MTTEALSPISAAIAEFLAAVGSTCGNRIRPYRPAAGDALGAGHYQRFATIDWLDGPPMSHMPIRDVTLVGKFYGVNDIDAEAFGMLAEAVVHDVGARQAASGLGVWFSTVVSSGHDGDPVTLQPLWTIIFRYPTTLAAII
jgi:hypothetical protein